MIGKKKKALIVIIVVILVPALFLGVWMTTHLINKKHVYKGTFVHHAVGEAVL